MQRDPELSRTIESLVAHVWNEVIGHGLRDRQRACAPASSDGPFQNVAIGIEGDWNGDVRLHCPLGTARELAASFFRRPSEQIGPADIEATLLELANILGGNLKSALPGTNHLRLPRLGELDESAGQLVHEQGVSLNGWPLQLRLYQRSR
jgi:chemotaxis protein CheX